MISNGLIQKFRNYFAFHSGLSYVVKPAIPIVYFGDEPAYRRSEIKIVTVGLNPSDNEFTEDGHPYSIALRFPSFANSSGTDNDLVKALNEYFYPVNKPYGWFGCFEPFLNGMNSSYYQGHANTVLHTDICSPVATNPTWSHLQGAEKDRLLNNSSPCSGGMQLWEELISELEPDYILMSIRKEYLERYLSSGNVTTISKATFGSLIYKSNGELRNYPYNIELIHIKLHSGKYTRIIFGRSNIKPFMDIDNKSKTRLGSQIIKNK